MKKKNIILLFLLVLAGVGCHKDTDPAAESPEVRNVKVNPSQTGAGFVWNVVDMPGKFQTGVEVSGHENMSDLLSLPALESEERFVASIDSLTPNTTYYYRIVVWNRFKRFEFPQGNGTAFTTSETPTPPGQDTTSYTITVSVNLAEGGTARGGGCFAEGDTCTVTATANEGYVFVNWTEEGTSVADSMTYSFEVRRDRHLVANFVEESAVLYTVTAQAEPEEGGRVTGGGTYEEGQTCTLTATAYECYVFVNWTKDGEEVSQDTVCTFEVTGDVTCMAHFQLKRYAITVAADPTNGGEVIGGDTYDCGETCTVRATEAQGYTFVNWTENNTVVSSDDDYTFTVERGRDLVANFVELQPNQYVIQVVIDPSGGGTVIGNGPYNEGQTCTLTATPENCYAFVNWTKNGEVVSQNSVYTFNVTEAATYVAHFRLINYKVTVSAGTGGSAYVGEMQGVFSQNVDCGESCTVHARPEQGYTFVNWTENGIEASRERDYTFNVTDNHNLTANFTQETYTITVNAGTGGHATGGGTFHYGETATLTATADECYQFESWSDGSTDSLYVVTVTGDATYTANFSRKEYTITVTHGTGGTAHVGNNTSTTSAPFTCGSSCTVHATANPGYTFTNWKEGSTVVSTEANYTFEVGSARTLKANFALEQYTVSVSAYPTVGGTAYVGNSVGTTQATFTYGETCLVHARAASSDGYDFSHWLKDGSMVPDADMDYLFQVTGEHHLQARFMLRQYQISVNASPTDGGTVSINGGGTSATFTHGTTITLRANANAGYTFGHWQDGNTQNPRQITVTAAVDYTAYFDAQPQAPTGALPGKFTINSSGDKVYFSQGNLQYQASTNTWQFAANQYDYIGGDNSNISQTYSGWIDLFGWGTSGWNNGNTYYHPWDSDNSDGTLYGPPGQYNLTGTYANADWGFYNAISNGGGQAGQWLTLTYSEWDYVFRQRNTTSDIRFVKAKITGTSNGTINGVVLLPDNWAVSTYALNNPNPYDSNSGSYEDNTISQSDWNNIFQANGAVFLPAAGYRYGASVYNVGSRGGYWSASFSYSTYACRVYFDGTDLYTGLNGYRYFGQSVRLVCPAEN